MFFKFNYRNNPLSCLSVPISAFRLFFAAPRNQRLVSSETSLFALQKSPKDLKSM